MNFKNWYNLEEIRSPDDLINLNGAFTFSYFNKIKKIFITYSHILHYELNPYFQKMKINKDEDEKIDGRFIYQDKSLIISFWGSLDRELELVHQMEIIAYSMLEFLNKKNTKCLVKGSVGSQKEIIPLNGKIKHIWVDVDGFQTTNDEEDNCPKIDYPHLMSLAHTANSDEKQKLQAYVCNLKIDPNECPKLAKQVDELKLRFNCTKYSNEKQYQDMLQRAKLR